MLITDLHVQFVIPSMALRVLDRAIQAYGAEGVSQDQILARFYAGVRTLRLADVSLIPHTVPFTLTLVPSSP